MQLDLIDAVEASYPSAPGFREKGGASEEAARAVAPKAATTRKDVLRLLESHPDGLTAPAVRRLLKGRYTLNSIRSRLTELSSKDKDDNQYAEKTNLRREDPDSGFAVAVYRSLLFSEVA